MLGLSKPRDVDRIARIGLLLTLIVLVSLTWRKWGYLPIDSGREMYVPAAISEGRRLYFDLTYPYGPLIPYWHAALFRLFGIHLGVLIGAGVSVVGIATLLFYSVSRVFLPVWLSFAAVFVFLMQACQVDLFNYILPYSYPAAYGSMFAVLLLWLLLRRFESRYIAAAGFLAGLMMLTKLEFGVAGYAGLGCAIVIRSVQARSIRTLVECLCACIPGAVLWLGIYGWYLHAAGADFFLGDNLAILPSSHFQRHFAKLWNEKTGLVLSPRALAISAARGLSGFGVLAGCVVLAARSKLARWTLPVAAVGLCGIHLVAIAAHAANVARIDRLAVKVLHPVFFNSGMIWVGLVVLVLAARDKQPSAVVLCAMAMACGLRVLTRIAPNGYSIYFDVLVYQVLLVGLYRVSKQFSVDLDGAFGNVVAGILCLSMVTLTLEYYPIRSRSYMVSSARGTLYATPEVGRGFSQALRFLEAAKQKSRRVVVMPEDTALYFFSGDFLRDTGAPSRWYIVTPQVLPPGEATAQYIDDLERAGIHYVIVSDRATPEFGFPVFGIDYGQQIFAWLGKNYRVVQRIGEYQPVAFPREWGALVYERRP